MFILLLSKYSPAFRIVGLVALNNPKVEFVPKSTSNFFPLSTLKVSLNFVASAEYRPTAPVPTINFEFEPNPTCAFPSE